MANVELTPAQVRALWRNSRERALSRSEVAEPSDVVFLGVTAAGKSSLINMIATALQDPDCNRFKFVAEPGRSEGGQTTREFKHRAVADNFALRFWDMMGIDNLNAEFNKRLVFNACAGYLATDRKFNMDMSNMWMVKWFAKSCVFPKVIVFCHPVCKQHHEHPSIGLPHVGVSDVLGICAMIRAVASAQRSKVVLAVTKTDLYDAMDDTNKKMARNQLVQVCNALGLDIQNETEVFKLASYQENMAVMTENRSLRDPVKELVALEMVNAIFNHTLNRAREYWSGTWLKYENYAHFAAPPA